MGWEIGQSRRCPPFSFKKGGSAAFRGMDQNLTGPKRWRETAAGQFNFFSSQSPGGEKCDPFFSGQRNWRERAFDQLQTENCKPVMVGNEMVVGKSCLAICEEKSICKSKVKPKAEQRKLHNKIFKSSLKCLHNKNKRYSNL